MTIVIIVRTMVTIGRKVRPIEFRVTVMTAVMVSHVATVVPNATTIVVIVVTILTSGISYEAPRRI